MLFIYYIKKGCKTQSRISQPFFINPYYYSLLSFNSFSRLLISFSSIAIVCVRDRIFSLCLDTMDVIDIRIAITNAIARIKSPFILPCIPMIPIIIVSDSGQITKIPIHNPAKSHSKVYFKEISLFFRSKSIKIKYMIKTKIRLIRSLSGIILFPSSYSKTNSADKNCQSYFNHIINRASQIN